MSCATKTSKAVLYFVAVCTLLIGLSSALVTLFYEDQNILISIANTLINLSLGLLLLVGLIKKDNNLVEAFVYITACLLVIVTLGFILFVVTYEVSSEKQNYIVGMLVVRWLVQFVISWAYNQLKTENSPERLVEEDVVPEKPTMKV